MYEYNAKVLAVTDGDTLDLEVDLGFYPITTRLKRARFYGINAPEKSTQEGKNVKAWLEARLPIGSMVRIKTVKMRTGREKGEKFGGFLVHVYEVPKPDTELGQSLNDEMVELGFAVPYFGGAR